MLSIVIILLILYMEHVAMKYYLKLKTISTGKVTVISEHDTHADATVAYVVAVDRNSRGCFFVVWGVGIVSS